MNKQAEAAEIVRLAKEAGCQITLRGDWVEFKPPLPMDLLLRSMDVADEIAAIFKETQH